MYRRSYLLPGIVPRNSRKEAHKRIQPEAVCMHACFFFNYVSCFLVGRTRCYDRSLGTFWPFFVSGRRGACPSTDELDSLNTFEFFQQISVSCTYKAVGFGHPTCLFRYFSGSVFFG